MGTPDFSVPPLLALHDSSYNVTLVVTQPDRPKGRGRKKVPPPVKNAATKLGYEVFQPTTLSSDEVVERLRIAEPDFIVTAAYGRILPSKVLGLPEVAPINIHASLLPKYRGAAPIQRAIINGETETGVTIMLMDTGLDTGDILLSQKISINADDTAQTLHDRLAEIGGPLLVKTLQGIVEKSIVPAPQHHELASYAERLAKKDGRIQWAFPAKQIINLIRGTTPWPGAFTFYQDQRYKILKAVTVSQETTEPPGTVLKGFPGELRVATQGGALSILEIQGASGKRLPIADFLRGHDFPFGTRFT